MYIERTFEGIHVQIVGPEPDQEGTYHVNVSDKTHELVLMSMISDASQRGYEEAFYRIAR